MLIVSFVIWENALLGELTAGMAPCVGTPSANLTILAVGMRVRTQLAQLFALMATIVRMLLVVRIIHQTVNQEVLPCLFKF